MGCRITDRVRPWKLDVSFIEGQGVSVTELKGQITVSVSLGQKRSTIIHFIKNTQINDCFSPFFLYITHCFMENKTLCCEVLGK